MTDLQPEGTDPPPSGRRLVFLLALITVVCLFLDHVPFAGLVIKPVRQMTTLIHELGHATACVATGGSVEGLTIVSDEKGHGGLTMTRGGSRYLTIPAGYLGAALVGSLLLLGGRNRQNAGKVLKVLAVVLGLAGLIFTSTTFFHSGDHKAEAGLSFLWVLGISVGLFIAGTKLSPPYAQFVLLFLAVQVALNAVTDTLTLITVSALYGSGGSFTDATAMAQLTGVPAFIWSVLWCALGIGMLWLTVKLGYLRNQDSPSTRP